MRTRTPITVEPARDWREDALCAQTDPEVFHPEPGHSVRAAKRVCMACEVRTECLDYALGAGEHGGVWGGLSDRERRALQRQRGAAA